MDDGCWSTANHIYIPFKSFHGLFIRRCEMGIVLEYSRLDHRFLLPHPLRLLSNILIFIIQSRLGVSAIFNAQGTRKRRPDSQMISTISAFFFFFWKEKKKDL